MIIKILLIIADSFSLFKSFFGDLLLEIDTLISTDFFNILRFISYYFRGEGNLKYLFLLIFLILFITWLVNRKKK
tara:strand:- start:625 stop:849 length:225 start_codon:yes stop_codon:yes gene_type:complete